MGIVITGGTGFVMAHAVKRWAEARPDAGPIYVIDRALPDNRVKAFLGSLANQVTFIKADVGDRATWTQQIDPVQVTYVVHGAAATPHSYKAPDGRMLSSDRDAPMKLIEGNLLASAGLFDWARQLPQLRRLIFISSGAVYGSLGPNPLPEEGFVDPRTLYAICKEASERILRRMTEMYEFSAASLRPSGVYGALDRDTADRKIHSAPFKIAQRIKRGEAVKVLSLEASADWISADDIADAILALLAAPKLSHSVYNVAYGELVSVQRLIEAFKKVAGNFAVESGVMEGADIALEARQPAGNWAAYDIQRLSADANWRPKSIEERVADYWRELQKLPD